MTASCIVCGFNSYRRPHVVERDINDAKNQPRTCGNACLWPMRYLPTPAFNYEAHTFPRPQTSTHVILNTSPTVTIQPTEPTRPASCTKPNPSHGLIDYVINDPPLSSPSLPL